MAALNLAQQLSSSNPAAMRSGSPESVGDARPTWSVLASGTPHISPGAAVTVKTGTLCPAGGPLLWQV